MEHKKLKMASKIISLEENEGVLSVHTDQLQRCLTPHLEKKVKVISVCGEFRTGKSTLLNTWMNKHGFFEVGHTTQAKTKGVWMGVIEDENQVIILLDFEGLYNSQSGGFDSWLLLIMIFVSNETVLNCRGSINGLTVKHLLHILIVCKNDAATVAAENWQIPHAIFIVRDFENDHHEGQNDDDYLNDILTADNKYSRILKNYLGEKKKCYTLPRPHRLPKSLGSLGEDGRIVDVEADFLEKAQMIFNYILNMQGNNLMKCSDWIRVVRDVTQKIEEIRQSDPQGTRINTSIPKRELLDMVNNDFAEGMARLDAITEDLQQIRGGEPYDKEKTKKNKDKSLKETVKAWGESDTHLLKFVNDFEKTMRKLNDITAKDYEQMYGTNASLKGFEAHLTKNCHGLERPYIKNFYLKQHLHLQYKIVTQWMDDHKICDIQRSLAMARVDDKEKKNNSTLRHYLLDCQTEVYSDPQYSFLEELKSPDLFQPPKDMSGIAEQITAKVVKQIIHLQKIINTCFIPFTELQHQFLLLDVQRDFLFGNLLEVYNCCVQLWNIFLEPICRKMPQVNDWERVCLVDTLAPLIKFQNFYENMDTYIVNKRKQNPGLHLFLGWSECALEMTLLSANKKTAEHCKQMPESLKKLLDEIHKDKCPDIYRDISRLEKRLNSSDNDVLQFELSLFNDSLSTHPEAKTIDIGALEQVQIDKETEDEVEQLLMAEYKHLKRLRLLVFLQDLVKQVKEVHLMEEFDHNIFQGIRNVYKSHAIFWKSLNNMHPLKLPALSTSLREFTSDLEVHRLYLCEEQDTVKQIKNQMSGKTHFAALLKLVVKQKWWEPKADLVDIFKEPATHMKILLKIMGKIQCVIPSYSSGALEEGKTSIEKLLQTINKDADQREAADKREATGNKAEDMKEAADKIEAADKKEVADKKEATSKRETAGKSLEFERKTTFLRNISNLRIDLIEKTATRLIETSPKLCEEFIFCHQEFWVRRSHTLHILKELQNDLQSGKLGFNITKLVTSLAGIASGGLGIASVLLPFLLPGVIAAGVTVGVASLATVISSRVFSNIMENKISAALLCDTISSASFESAFERLEKEIEQQKVQKTHETPEGRVNPAEAIGGAVRGVGAAVQVGRGVLKVADVCANPLVVAGHIAGGVAGGVGILVDAVQMGITIHDMVKNGSKDERSQYVSECIKLMELEMEYNAKIAIPLKYHMFKRCIEKVMHKQK